MYELTYVLQQNEIDLFAALPGALAQADAFITENYLKLPKKRMATMLNRSDTFVRRRLNVLGLVVPKELSEQFSKDSRIQQGAVPPNKGKKQTDYMSAEAIEATKATRFKKGQICQTEKQDGQVTVRHDEMKDGSIRDYKWIRIGKSKWKMLHVYNWEKKHKRKVPKGHILVFANGDSMNCNPSNLELITRAENMRRNTIHRYPEELKSVIKLRSKLNKTIHNQTKKVKQ